MILDPERCFLLLLLGISTEWAIDCFEGRSSNHKPLLAAETISYQRPVDPLTAAH